MQKMRHLIIVAAVLAMALTTIGAPVSAAGKGTIAVVNGSPGQRIDVCFGRKEIRSGLKYGQKVVRRMGAGSKVLRIYKANRRVCRGRLLARESFPFPARSDHTIVISRFGPRIQHFDNKDFGGPAAPGPASVLFWRNASDIAGVSLDLDADFPAPLPFAPAVDPVWAKGNQKLLGNADPSLIVITTVFSIADTATILGEADARLVKLLFRYEWILIGTNPFNARLLVIKRPIPAFS
jgi:hypothetical protein